MDQYRIIELEGDQPSLQRRRLLAQIDLSFVDLTPEQDAVVDELCELLRRLPQTRTIERILDGHWPQ